MSDANGDGTGESLLMLVPPLFPRIVTDTREGGSSVIQVTGSGLSSCATSLSSNHTTQSFSFNASGEINQCGDDFHLDWDYSEDMEPYNVSIVPLDQSFRAFSVRMDDASSLGSINWVVNLQAGIKFTLMFKYVHHLLDHFEVTMIVTNRVAMPLVMDQEVLVVSIKSPSMPTCRPIAV